MVLKAKIGDFKLSGHILGNVSGRFFHLTLDIHKNPMYICLMYSKELLKGTLRTIVLKLLAEEGRMYGYEITQKVKDLTKGKVVLTEGALYPTLHKLEAEGYLQSEEVQIGKRLRKYYTLTPVGSGVATAMVKEFSEFVNTMKLIIGPSNTAEAWSA